MQYRYSFFKKAVSIVFIFILLRYIYLVAIIGSKIVISPFILNNDTAPVRLTCNPRQMELRNREPFNLTLDIRLDPKNTATRATACRPMCQIYQLDTCECITFDQIMHITDQNVKRPMIYSIYPQDVPLENIISAVERGRSIFEAPKFNYPISLLNVSKGVCAFTVSGEPARHYDIVIVVKSGVYNFERRRWFRRRLKAELALSPEISVAFVFSLGLPRKTGGNVFDREGTPYTLNTTAGQIMKQFDGRYDEVRWWVYYEIAEHDDIILGDYEDTYYNLTYKANVNFRWASAFCEKATSMVLICDDDYVVSTVELRIFLQKITHREQRNMFIAEWYDDIASRNFNEKNYLSEHDVPWNHQALYPVGFAMFIGMDLLPRLAIAAIFTKHMPLDDVWLGLLVTKLNITRYNLKYTYTVVTEGNIFAPLGFTRQ